MRSALPTLLFAVLLVTAGCSGTFDGDPATETTTDAAAESATTAGAESTTGTTTPVADRDFPSGLTDEGLADPDSLVSAHADALQTQSVTLRERRVRRYENGSLRWRTNLTLRSVANRTRFHSVTETTDRPVFGASEGRVAVFADGERVYRSVETSNTSWSGVLRNAMGDPDDPRSVKLGVARTDDLYVVLNAFALDDSESVRNLADDPQRYRLESSTLAHADLLSSHLNLTEVGNATLTAVVTPDGLVEQLHVEFVGTKNGTVVRGTTTLRYSRVGETAVEAPTWYEDG